MGPEELKNYTIYARHLEKQFKLEEFTESELRTLKKYLRATSRKIVSRAQMDGGPAAALEIQKMTLAVKSSLGSYIESTAEAVYQASADAVFDVLSFSGKARNISFSMPSPGQIKAAIRAPLGGGLIDEWVEKAVDGNIRSMVQRELVSEFLAGSSTQQMAKALSVAFNMTSREAETLARTWFSRANADATMEVYYQNQDVIKKVEWSAVMEVNAKSGRGTCLSCASLDGLQWALDDSTRPSIPKHPRCRCFYASVTASYRDLGLDIDEISAVAKPYSVGSGTTQKVGQYQGDFESWLKKQPDKYQLSMLGPTRFEKFKSGEWGLHDMTDARGNVKLLKRGSSGSAVGLVTPNVPEFTPPPEPIIEPDSGLQRAILKNHIMSELGEVSPQVEKLIDDILDMEHPTDIEEALGQIMDFRSRLDNTPLKHQWEVWDKDYFEGFNDEVERITEFIDQIPEFEDMYELQGEFFDHLPSYEKWVRDTKWGNIKNGRTLKLLEEMVDNGNVFLDHGLVPIVENSASDEFLKSMLVETKAIKNSKYMANTRQTISLLKSSEVINTAKSEAAFGNLPEVMFKEFDFEKNTYFRRSASYRSVGLPWGENYLGKELDFGYASFSDIGYNWTQEMGFLIEVPDSEIVGFIEENTTLEKLEKGTHSITPRDVLGHRNERELVMKNRYEVVGQEEDKTGKVWLKLRPIK